VRTDAAGRGKVYKSNIGRPLVTDPSEPDFSFAELARETRLRELKEQAKKASVIEWELLTAGTCESMDEVPPGATIISIDGVEQLFKDS